MKKVDSYSFWNYFDPGPHISNTWQYAHFKQKIRMRFSIRIGSKYVFNSLGLYDENVTQFHVTIGEKIHVKKFLEIHVF